MRLRKGLFFALLVYFTIDIGKLKQDLKLLNDMVMCYKNLFTPCTFDLQLTIFLALLAVIGNLCSWHLSVAALSATYSVCYIDICCVCTWKYRACYVLSQESATNSCGREHLILPETCTRKEWMFKTQSKLQNLRCLMLLIVQHKCHNIVITRFTTKMLDEDLWWWWWWWCILCHRLSLSRLRSKTAGLLMRVLCSYSQHLCGS